MYTNIRKKQAASERCCVGNVLHPRTNEIMKLKKMPMRTCLAIELATFQVVINHLRSLCHYDGMPAGPFGIRELGAR